MLKLAELWRIGRDSDSIYDRIQQLEDMGLDDLRKTKQDVLNCIELFDAVLDESVHTDPEVEGHLDKVHRKYVSNYGAVEIWRNDMSEARDLIETAIRRREKSYAKLGENGTE